MTPSICIYEVGVKSYRGNHRYFLVLASEEVSTNAPYYIWLMELNGSDWTHEELSIDKILLEQRLLEYMKGQNLDVPWAEFAFKEYVTIILNCRYKIYTDADKTLSIWIDKDALQKYNDLSFFPEYLREHNMPDVLVNKWSIRQGRY